MNDETDRLQRRMDTPKTTKKNKNSDLVAKFVFI